MRRILLFVVVFAMSLLLSRAVLDLTRPTPPEPVPSIVLRRAPAEPGGGAGPRPEEPDRSGPGGGATPASPPPPPRAGANDDEDDDGDAPDTPDTDSG